MQIQQSKAEVSDPKDPSPAGQQNAVSTRAADAKASKNGGGTAAAQATSKKG